MKADKLTREQFIEKNIELAQDRIIKQRIIIFKLIDIPRIVFKKNKLIS
jgi:hypothetical protein